MYTNIENNIDAQQSGECVKGKYLEYYLLPEKTMLLLIYVLIHISKTAAAASHNYTTGKT